MRLSLDKLASVEALHHEIPPLTKALTSQPLQISVARFRVCRKNRVAAKCL